jgi:pentatricopeptide repeat protein
VYQYPKVATALLQDMRDRNVPGDLQLYAKVIATYCSCRMLRESVEILSRLKVEGIHPTFAIFKIVFDRLHLIEDKKEAIQLLNTMKNIMHDFNIDIPVHYSRLEESIKFGEGVQDDDQPSPSLATNQEEEEENGVEISPFNQMPIPDLNPEQIQQNMNFTLKLSQKIRK